VIRLAVVGSRCLAGNAAAQQTVLAAITYWLSQAPDGQFEVVSGGAIGVDEMAERVAAALNLPTRIFCPDPKELAKAGNAKATWPIYRARNAVLAEHATHLLCVRCPESSTKGAWWTEREARRLRKRVLPAVEITCSRHERGAAR